MKEKISIPNRGQFKTFVKGKVPGKEDVFAFLGRTIAYLFPILNEGEHSQNDTVDCMNIENHLRAILATFDTGLADNDKAVHTFLHGLPNLYDLLVGDADAIFEGDPAARTVVEVIISYPGFFAILVYRIAHLLDDAGIPVMPRMLTEYAHSKTGIDIHPKAEIGESFCIDHGTGVVIGETTEIGDHVKIYQGVTLGAISVSKEKADHKRHPTIEDYVTIYSGATILGGNTRIGRHAVIGGSVWLTRSVDPFSVVINKSEVIYKKNGKNEYDFIDYSI